jgi:folate-binding protein YgfZ
MNRSCLAALHEARGAQWMEQGGWEIPAVYSRLEQEYQALQQGVGLVDFSHLGKLRVTGRDRRTWLHGQVTQEIKGLADGRATYAALMTPQGRMVSDLRVYAVPEALLAVAPAGTEPPIPEYLERFLIMERAEVEDLTVAWALLSLIGPLSSSALAAVAGEAVCAMQPWDVRAETWNGDPLYAARVPQCGEDGFDLLLPAEHAAPLWAALCQGRREFAVHSVGWEALNVRRVEAGVPWWGAELDPTIVPLEARLDHAISRTKGCYVGQEIIARIDARGHVNNLLAGFLVHGEALPPAGAEIQKDGKKVGRVTSAVHSLALDRRIALGFLRREHQEPGTRVQAVAEGGAVELEVTPLPFVPNDDPEPCGA